MVRPFIFLSCCLFLCFSGCKAVEEPVKVVITPNKTVQSPSDSWDAPVLVPKPDPVAAPVVLEAPVPEKIREEEQPEKVLDRFDPTGGKMAIEGTVKDEKAKKIVISVLDTDWSLSQDLRDDGGYSFEELSPQDYLLTVYDENGATINGGTLKFGNQNPNIERRHKINLGTGKVLTPRPAPKPRPKPRPKPAS